MNNNSNINNNGYQNQNNQQNLYGNQQIVINSQQTGLNNQGMITENFRNDNRPIKKGKLGLIIVLVSVVVVSAIIFIYNYFFNGEESGKDLLNNNSQTNSEKDNLNVNWDDYELVIDGVSIKLPMTYKEFMSKGFYIQDYRQYNPNLSLEDKVIKSGTAINSYVHNNALITNGTTNNISLTIHNPSNEDKSASESYVVGIACEEPYTVSTTKYGEYKIINHTKNTEIVFGKTTRDEVLDLFGDLHYSYDSSDELNYYVDINGDNIIDVDDLTLDAKQLLSLEFDENTGILKLTKDFWYLDYGYLSK